MFEPIVGGPMAGFLVIFLLSRYILQVVKFGSEIEYDLFKTFIIHSILTKSQHNYPDKE